MEFTALIGHRRSIRAFQSRSIDVEILQSIFEAVNLAPSAGNLQAYEIYVVADITQRADLARAALGQEFIAEAPVVLVFCANPARSAVRYRDRGMKLYSIQDATIACTYAMLAATDRGMGSVWVGAFDEREVRRALAIPDDLLPVALLPVGYPAESPTPKPRRPLRDLVKMGWV